MSEMPKKGKDRHLEADVNKAVQEVLTRHGWFWWMPPSNMYSKVGISDVHAVRDGLFMAIETKRSLTKSAKPKPTANQIAFLQSIRSARHFAFVVNEERVKHLDAFLTSFHLLQSIQQWNGSTEGKLKGLRPVPDDHGAQMINCMREMQQEI
jgi:hypothetical protein